MGRPSEDFLTSIGGSNKISKLLFFLHQWFLLWTYWN